MSPYARKHLIELILFLIVLYVFFVSIEMMSGAFKLFGKDFAKNLMTTTSNPVVGLMIGLLATSLVQSSSATTSILVGLVAGGGLSITNAIPVVMGANIGTTVTNTIVSVGHIGRRNEFSRALSAATVHDFFNILAVTLFLPLEHFTHIISRSAMFLADSFDHIGGLKFVSPLKAIVKPVTEMLINGIQSVLPDPAWATALSILVFALVMLFLALKYMVDLMKKVAMGRVENLLHQYLFSSPVSAFILGLAVTAIIQSSSATTSLIVPIVAAGILNVADIFPFVLGTNIGTTITAILASLVTKNPAALSVAFAHLLFNVGGTICFYPLKKIPIAIACQFGKFTANHRYIVLTYLVLMFYGIPLLIIFLSRGGF
ncbi:Na/Pi symporter [bacterium]|nr:Na/Pi symporter [bacterium]